MTWYYVFRYKCFCAIKDDIENREGGIETFSRGYERFGLNKTPNGLVYREWAPGAHGVFLTGDFSKCHQCCARLCPRSGSGLPVGLDRPLVSMGTTTLVIYQALFWSDVWTCNKASPIPKLLQCQIEVTPCKQLKLICFGTERAT